MSSRKSKGRKMPDLKVKVIAGDAPQRVIDIVS